MCVWVYSSLSLYHHHLQEMVGSVIFEIIWWCQCPPRHVLLLVITCVALMIKLLCFVLYYCFCHLAVVELDHFVLLKLDSFSTDGKEKQSYKMGLRFEWSVGGGAKDHGGWHVEWHRKTKQGTWTSLHHDVEEFNFKCNQSSSWEMDEPSYTCSSQTLFCFNLLWILLKHKQPYCCCSSVSYRFVSWQFIDNVYESI